MNEILMTQWNGDQMNRLKYQYEKSKCILRILSVPTLNRTNFAQNEFPVWRRKLRDDVYDVTFKTYWKNLEEFIDVRNEYNRKCQVGIKYLTRINVGKLYKFAFRRTCRICKIKVCFEGGQ